MGVCVALILTAVVGGSAYYARHGDELKEAISQHVREIGSEAKSYAEAHDQNDCLSEGGRRLAKCGFFDFTCEGVTSGFTRICLHEAERVEGLCAGVPAPASFFEAAEWAEERCEAFPGIGRARCTRWMQGLQDHCEGEQEDV